MSTVALYSVKWVDRIDCSRQLKHRRRSIIRLTAARASGVMDSQRRWPVDRGSCMPCLLLVIYSSTGIRESKSRQPGRAGDRAETSKFWIERRQTDWTRLVSIHNFGEQWIFFFEGGGDEQIWGTPAGPTVAKCMGWTAGVGKDGSVQSRWLTILNDPDARFCASHIAYLKPRQRLTLRPMPGGFNYVVGFATGTGKHCIGRTTFFVVARFVM